MPYILTTNDSVSSFHYNKDTSDTPTHNEPVKKTFYPQESGRGWARKTWQLRLLTDMAFFG